MNTAKRITGVLAACLMLMSSHAAYAGIAGKVQFANGSVRLVSESGKSHDLRKGESISEKDTVATGKDSSAQIRMVDGGLIAVRPDTELKFDSVVFNGKQDGSEKGYFNLLRGGMRAITGLIGQHHKANYRITTPTATIGIRGTDHETYVIVPGSALAATVPAGTYNKVNAGGTVMTTGNGAVNIQPNQMGYATASNQAPQLLPVNLNIFTVPPAPAPQANAGPNQVRANAVVDNAVLGQGTIPATIAATTSGASIIRAPIVGQYQTGGITSPPVSHTIVF
jgi:hypothetical protein